MLSFKCYFTVFIAFQALICLANSKRVKEMGYSFLDMKKDGDWLVMFYAPWCAHCKRLDPVFAHVAQSLYNSKTNVGRLDCTKFGEIAAQYNITGFPTIMFFKHLDSKNYTYTGERSREDIYDFAMRLSGPPIKSIVKPERYKQLKDAHQLFFVYVGDYEGPLWDVYNVVAENFHQHCYFYSSPYSIAKEHFRVSKDTPAVLVSKEDDHYFYNPEEEEFEQLNSSLHDWVNTERFKTYIKVTRNNIHQLYQTNKYLALTVVKEDKLGNMMYEMQEFKELMESISSKDRNKYFRWIQFGWISSPELANSIAMTELLLPNLLVLNSTTKHYHLPEDPPLTMSEDAIHLFLESVIDQSVPAYGGNSFFIRLYRAYYELTSSLVAMWKGNPVLTTLLFGMPLGFLLLICYGACCPDFLEAEEDDDEEEETHEKKE